MIPGRPRIAIIGAGIGGLTAAVALRQRGFDPQIFEQANALGEVGAGLTITASATLALNALKLGEAFAQMEPCTPHFGALDPVSGLRLNYEQRDLEAYVARYGASTRHVHRADLHQLLVRTIPAASVHAGHELEQIVEVARECELTFANGRVEKADLVIACDGLKSVVRQQHFSPAPATFTGYVAWRGLVDRDTLPELCVDPHFATFASADKLFARYPLRGGTLINYVAIARKPDFTSESWHTRAQVADVVREFSGWHGEVTDIIAATPKGRCMCWALYTRAPLKRWVTDEICLLGDAAHPMTPFYGMGAAMAIEDGVVLARCLEDSSSVASALLRYQNARLERGNLMQQISLQRAKQYMSENPSERGSPPAAGLQSLLDYNPATVPV